MGIFSNPEVKGAAIKLLSIAMVFIIISVALISFNFAYLNKMIIDKNISIMGKIAYSHPELKDDIITLFTSKPTKEQLDAGLNEARKYGYDKSLPYTVNPIVFDTYRLSAASFMGVFLLFFAALSGIVFILLKGIYIRINDIALAAEQIVEGDFDVKLSQDSEGDFSKLGHQFNEMAKRLKLSVESLENEKVFLKDTISDISHQLKTPLSSLKMFNELLLDGAVEDKTVLVEFLESSKSQLDRMEWLILNLLKMARLEAGAVEFDMKRYRAKDTVLEAVRPLELVWKGKGHKVEIVEESPNINLQHDKNWLSQAITNIVKNCIESTPEKGKINIRITENPVLVRIIIQDTGKGISSEELTHIFKRFYKPKTSAESEGIGIGLALSKAIIEGQGGIISVKSVLNEGTTFTIAFSKVSTYSLINY